MKYLILIILPLALISAGCTNKQSSFEKNLKCKEIALELDSQYKSDSFVDSQTIYSESLETCLYKYSTYQFFVATGMSLQYSAIINSLTNEKLADYMTNSNMSTEEEYELQKNFYEYYNKYFLKNN